MSSRGNELFSSWFLLKKGCYGTNGILQSWQFSLWLSLKEGPAWFDGNLTKVHLFSLFQICILSPWPSSSSSSTCLLFLIKLSAQSTPTWALQRLSAGPSGSLHSQTPAAARRNHIYLFMCSCFKWSSLPTMPLREIRRSGEGERKNTMVLPTGETWDSPLPRTPGIEAPFHLQESCRVGGVCSWIAVFPFLIILSSF